MSLDTGFKLNRRLNFSRTASEWGILPADNILGKVNQSMRRVVWPRRAKIYNQIGNTGFFGPDHRLFGAQLAFDTGQRFVVSLSIEICQ